MPSFIESFSIEKPLVSDNEEQPEYKEYSYRFVIAASFCFLNFTNGFLWVVISPISVPISNAYGVSALALSLVPMSYMFAFPFVNFPSNWVTDHKGLIPALYTGGILTTVGSIMRCFTNFSIIFLVVGQVICAVAQPFIINAVAKVGIRWFKPENRSLAITIMTTFNIVGCSLGFLFPTVFVTSKDNQTIKKQFFKLLCVEAIFPFLSMVSLFIFFRESPPTPASAAEDEELGEQQASFTSQLADIFTDGKFIALLIAFGFLNGNLCTYGSIPDELLDPFNFTNPQVGNIGTITYISGIIGAILISIYVKKTGNYRVSFIILSILGIVQAVGWSVFMNFAEEVSQRYIVGIFLGITQGLMIIPIMPITYLYACDIMYPYGEALLAGCLNTMGQIFSIIQIVIVLQGIGLGKNRNDTATNQSDSIISTYFVQGLTIIGCVMYLFFNSQLKRTHFQKESSNKTSSKAKLIIQ